MTTPLRVSAHDARTVGLTPALADLLSFIRIYVGERGVPPTFDEMKDGLCLASKSRIARMLDSLEERGLVRRTGHRVRAIELTDSQTFRLPADAAATLCAAARAAGRTPDEHAAALIRHHCPDLKPVRPTPVSAVLSATV